MNDFSNSCSSQRTNSTSIARGVIECRSQPDGNCREIMAKARGLMAGYATRWANDGWRASDIGKTFHLPIINPASGRRSRTFTRAGRYAGIVEREGERLLLVLRTAAEPIEETGAPFWQRSAIDCQSGTYCLAQLQQRRPLTGILFDVLRRPAIKPRAIPKGSDNRTNELNEGTLHEIARRGTYFGRSLQVSQRRAVLEGDGRETPELYEIRVEADTLRRPDWYFHRRIVRYDRRQADRDKAELWQTATEIRLAQRTDNHWRNSHSCHRYGRPCSYLPICSGTDTPHSDRWRPVEALHPELDNLPADVKPSQVLTHSRMQCFKLCRRKHYYRYELRIEPVQERADDTIRLVRVIHRALAAWWGRKRGQPSAASSMAR